MRRGNATNARGPSIIMLVMLLSFFLLLPRGLLKTARRKESEYEALSAEEVENHDDDTRETADLLNQSESGTVSPAYGKVGKSLLQRALSDLKGRLHRAKYTINQGVAPTLLFPLSESPFKHYRAFYPTYSKPYQAGVFISRSSLALFRIRALYTPSILQCMNFALLTAHAMTPFMPSIFWIFAIILWDGLLGGLVYVSTFPAMREEVAEEEREFSFGAVTVVDSTGICLARFLGVAMEKALCGYQVAHGRDWCTKM